MHTNDNCGSILFRIDFFASIRLKAFSMQNRSVKRNSSDAGSLIMKENILDNFLNLKNLRLYY